MSRLIVMWFSSLNPCRSRLAAGMAALALGWSMTTLAAPGAHGPNGEHLDASGNAGTASGLARLPDGSVQVPMLAQRRLGIRTSIALESDAAMTVELSGRVVIDPNASGRAQSVHGGRVMPGPRGLPVAGQAVRKGEVLVHVQHHAEPYAQAAQQSQLAELRSGRALAAQRVQRLEALEGTVPRKDIEAARAELQSLSTRERVIGTSISTRESLIAPVSGVIARADAVAGQIVEARDVLFEVIDPSRVLVEATTPDPALAARVQGASLQGAPGVKLTFLGAARSLRDGVLPLTFRAEASEAGMALPLAVGQPVTVLASFNEHVRGFVLPAAAIARNAANEPIVWIKSGAERYIARPVQFRPVDAGTVVVTQGLGADQRVVVQGASLIAQIR